MSETKSFLHRILTDGETFIQYDNPKCKKFYGKPGQQPNYQHRRIQGML